VKSKFLVFLPVIFLFGCSEPTYEECVREAVKDGKSEYGINVLIELCDQKYLDADNNAAAEGAEEAAAAAAEGAEAAAIEAAASAAEEAAKTSAEREAEVSGAEEAAAAAAEGAEAAAEAAY